MSWRHLPVVRHPCADLLLIQLLGILVHPFLGNQPLRRGSPTDDHAGAPRLIPRG